jgi:hypothetical protein
MAQSQADKKITERAARTAKDKSDKAAKADQDRKDADSDRSRSSRGAPHASGSADGSDVDSMADAPTASTAPVSLDSLAAQLTATNDRMAAQNDMMTNMMTALTTLTVQFGAQDTKFSAVDSSIARVNASLAGLTARLDSLEHGGAAPAASGSGPAPAAGGARAPPFSRVGVGAPSRHSAAGSDSDARTKVFFKNFPTAIPKRIGVAWFDALYAQTNKEPGVERHIGAQTSFAVSFPSAAAAKRFMDDVRDRNLELSFSARGAAPTTIKMEPQYISSLYGKAMATVWKTFNTHFEAMSTDNDQIRLIFETSRGKIRAEMGDQVLDLAHILDDKLHLNRANLDAVGFSPETIDLIGSQFVA